MIVLSDKLQFIGIKIANNPSNTLHYLQKAHLSSDTKLWTRLATKVRQACYRLQQTATVCNQKDELAGQIIENIFA